MKKTFSSQQLLKTAKWSGVYPIGLHGFELIWFCSHDVGQRHDPKDSLVDQKDG